MRSATTRANARGQSHRGWLFPPLLECRQALGTTVPGNRLVRRLLTVTTRASRVTRDRTGTCHFKWLNLAQLSREIWVSRLQEVTCCACSIGPRVSNATGLTRHHGLPPCGLARRAVSLEIPGREGIVAKRLADAYRPKYAKWHKVLNRGYSQRRSRAEWFRERRGRFAG
jgi:hypothetical protein